MDLSSYVESIRRDLVIAAEAAGEDARVAADRMAAALESGVRLTLLDALSEASAEITRDLESGSVEVRLRGREPEFVVTTRQDEDEDEGETEPPGFPGSSDAPFPPGPPAPPAQSASPMPGQPEHPGSPTAPPEPLSQAEDGGTTRLTLRMPEALKNRVEEAADADGLSVNQWLVRTVGAALSGEYAGGRGRIDPRADSTSVQRGRRGRAGRGYSGWVR